MFTTPVQIENQLFMCKDAAQLTGMHMCCFSSYKINNCMKVEHWALSFKSCLGFLVANVSVFLSVM